MLINRYKYSSPPKALVRDVMYLTRHAILYVKNGFRNKTILFYPDYPYRQAEINKIVGLTDYNITNNPRQKFDLVFHWEDVTVRRDDEFLQTISRSVPVINYRCMDISKTKVEEVFQSVFGYDSFLDPVTHQGTCVRKSILNGRHDGLIIECPIATPEPGFIYQRLLNNVVDDFRALDYRISVFGDAIPFVVLRYKSIDDRFDCTLSAQLAEPQDVFSPDELKKIRKFCRRIGLEYGELDIIRDRTDERIYILDANNTPVSPPSDVAIPKPDRRAIRIKSAEAFQENFLYTKRRVPAYVEDTTYAVTD